MNVLDVNCIAANAELQNDNSSITYETYLFTRTPEKTGGLSLISFAPEQLLFGCKIGHNVHKNVGQKDAEKNNPPEPQGNEFEKHKNVVGFETHVRSSNIQILKRNNGEMSG